jgi:uncharacterized membrane protein YccC
MAKRPANPRDLREAVERTVESTLGSAERSRDAAQGALDDVVSSVEERLARGRRSMAGAIEGRRPATVDDLRELRAELRAIGRRLDAIEERLPAKRTPAKKGAKRSSAKRAPAKRSPAKRSPAKRSS